MMTEEVKACAVPLCPAVPEGRFSLCKNHRLAVLAKGQTHLKCSLCRRNLKPTDYIYRSDGPTRHVQCAPAREKRPEHTTPLLDVGDVRQD